MIPSRRILVVDDDRDGAAALQFLLERRGYEVQVAHNGREAFDAIDAYGHPGLVILDLLMPVMNGKEFLAHCADNPGLATLPIIVLTATDSLVTGGVPVLKKPVNLDSLMAHITAVCGSASDVH